jgi:hypothetical protein
MAQVIVFISYSSLYKTQVADIVAMLTDWGTQVWVDHEKLTAGTPNWQKAIDEGIKKATYFVYIASPAANESPYVHDEIQRAIRYKKVIIPFWVDGVDWLDCRPMQLSQMQHIDARGQHYQDGKVRLAQVLRLQQPQKPSSSPIPVVASVPPPVQESPIPVIISSFVPKSLQSLGFVGQVYNNTEVIIPPMVTVPAGPFLMGSEKHKMMSFLNIPSI